MTEVELDLVEGWVEPELAEEFPELSLVHASVEVRPARSPKAVKQRLRLLADRYTGGKVVHMRQDPVPWAYRVFSRQVGIDPDHDRTPVEAVALRRLKQGGLHSDNLVDDALTIAVAETGVPLVALDAERVGGELGLRLGRGGAGRGRARRRGGRGGRPPPRVGAARGAGGAPGRARGSGARVRCRSASSCWRTESGRWRSSWARWARTRGSRRTPSAWSSAPSGSRECPGSASRKRCGARRKRFTLEASCLTFSIPTSALSRLGAQAGQ